MIIQKIREAEQLILTDHLKTLYQRCILYANSTIKTKNVSHQYPYKGNVVYSNYTVPFENIRSVVFSLNSYCTRKRFKNKIQDWYSRFFAKDFIWYIKNQDAYLLSRLNDQTSLFSRVDLQRLNIKTSLSFLAINDVNNNNFSITFKKI